MLFLSMLAMLTGFQSSFDLTHHYVRGKGTATVEFSIDQRKGVLLPRITNKGEAATIDEVVIADIPISLPLETAVYGEGFTMLSQTGGTLGRPVNIGAYTDQEHYRMPVPKGAFTVYNMLLLTPPQGDVSLLGFTTCKRFSGHFNVFPTHIEVVVDTEGLSLAHGETWDLEEFFVGEGQDSGDLLNNFATLTSKFAGKLRFKSKFQKF